jgi:hypothetical protein
MGGKNLSYVSNTINYTLAFAVLAFAAALIAAILAGYYGGAIYAQSDVSTVSILGNESIYCGSTQGCMVSVKRKLKDGTYDCAERTARPPGHVCSDQCVVGGTCTGYNPIDDFDRTPYCNATDYQSCRGACTTWEDCILPDWVEGGPAESGYAVCLSPLVDTELTGVCSFSAIYSNDDDGYYPPTYLFPYDTLSEEQLGPNAQICNWIIRDGLNLNNSKNCLDSATWAYCDGDCFSGCDYNYKCSRMNFLSADMPPFDIESLGVASTSSSSPPSRKLTVSAPPSVRDLFANVKDFRDLREASRNASIRLAKQRHRRRRR